MEKKVAKLQQKALTYCKAKYSEEEFNEKFRYFVPYAGDYELDILKISNEYEVYMKEQIIKFFNTDACWIVPLHKMYKSANIQAKLNELSKGWE